MAAASTLKRVKTCAFCGFSLGIVYTLWVGVVQLVTRGHSLQRMNISFGAVAAVYLVMGPIAGAIVGALGRVANSLVGAALVGVVAIVPVCLATRVALWGLHDWGSGDLVVLGAVTIFVGGGTGAYSRYLVDKLERRDAE